MERIFHRGLRAVLPIYGQDWADFSQVHSLEGDFIIDRSISCLLGHILAHYMISPREIKRRYGRLLDAKNLVPLPLDKDNILIPIKSRKPINNNHKAFGYVNINHILRVEERGGQVLVILDDFSELVCQSSYTSFISHYRRGEILRQCLSSGPQPSLEYRPATKKDLLLVFDMLREMEEYIKK